jgi:hypothetical protein
MSTEERLARIEEKLVHVIDGLSSLNQGLEKLIIPRIGELEQRVTKQEAGVAAEIKLLKIGLALALLLSGGSGAGILTKILGGP